MLKRYIKVRQNNARCHQLHQFVHLRIGINIMQANPNPKLTQSLGEIGDVRAQGPPGRQICAPTLIHPVCAGVLGNNQQFTHAGVNQTFGLAQHVAGCSTGQSTTHCWNDAESTLVIAALGNLQVSIMTRSQLNPAGRQQMIKRLVHRRSLSMDSSHDCITILWPGDRQQIWKFLFQ